MRSRGIELSECKKLMLYGFSNSIIDKIDSEPIKQEIKNKINTWLLNVN